MSLNGDVEKKPKGGWLCYDVAVSDISDRVSVLDRKLKLMDGLKSPRNVNATLEGNKAKIQNIEDTSNETKYEEVCESQDKSKNKKAEIAVDPVISSSDSEDGHVIIRKKQRNRSQRKIDKSDDKELLPTSYKSKKFLNRDIPGT
ncbi:uncharacterized protein [Chelonus insularis]|uniref:uncharacterized protein n=1 Tax=Chelonus insularis TaxID=460826 RepID=UPI00158BE707|nr:uncharacterized protein LOC118070040 [Chelonus insularis]